LLEISLAHCQANIDLVKNYVLASATKNVTEVDYRTADEGMCSANYFIYAKNNGHSSLEAFVTLFNYRLHFEEEWNLASLQPPDADNIVNIWLQPQLEKYCFTPLSVAEIQQETAWIIKNLTKLIVDNLAPVQPSATIWPNHWGIYLNRELVPSPTKFELPIVGEMRSGIGLYLDWNLVEIFYETTAEYVLFSWGTGA
jgi:hypothetical protein